ncbi:hypothetical protein FA15DRAFT_677719 [Coprinopsis marcescibilis]|uniref:Phosphatidylglycerol lysyltransferase C-terminal domain-containing protein n=1 Tax=Coprinopsis marcescibilis TaxID=230819 RepID=A0A5C3L9H3_COPMA|nr:hypothetical protein FA15DRAFT_677719 [Coprinopsis marcescibilis]
MTINTQHDSFDKASIAELVARYGSSSTTSWLEFDRYQIWRPTVPIPESEFLPVQGYMIKDSWLFAWGNPLVSSPAALAPTARAFIDFAESHFHPVWACVDRDLEEILGNEEFGWSTVSCIYEDFVDPAHVIELTSPDAKGKEGQHVVKDLKKNLNRAEKYDVHVQEIRNTQWKDADKKAVEEGIEAWKSGRSGIQIASTTLQPWLDQEHRRYWLARQHDVIVGILILTPIQANSWQIKNAVSFPNAPKGTSEALIYTALKDLSEEESSSYKSNGVHSISPAKLAKGVQNSLAHTDTDSETSISSTTVEPSSSDSESVTTPSASGVISPVSETGISGMTTPQHTGTSGIDSTLRDSNRVTVTFGISAAPNMEPVHNLGGWKVKALSKTYSKVASSTKIINRGEFRSKFDSEHEPMYVCYPQDGFGLEGVNALFNVLKK